MVKKGQRCPMLVVAKEGESVTCPICGTHVAEAATTAQSAQPARGPKRILYWTDPMIPGFKSDKPGKSPMGMEMIPVYEEELGPVPAQSAPPGYAPVMVSPQKQQLIGVKTAPVERRPLTKTIRTVGTVAHDPELYQAQQEFIQAQQAVRQAETGQMLVVMERAQRLVESSRLRLRHLGLNEQMIEEIGTRTEPDHRLLLGGQGQFWVYASVYEFELPLIEEGQTVTLDVTGLAGKTFTGTIKAIDPILDHATRTARVRILGDDPGGKLRPGMYVNASLDVKLAEALVVPSEAVFATGTKNIIFVDQGQGLFEPRDVVVGAEADGSTEIKEGLAEGERVVTSGNFLIDSESRLKSALQGMGAGAGTPPGTAESGTTPYQSKEQAESAPSMSGGGHPHGH
jgi:hypothetical protein